MSNDLPPKPVQRFSSDYLIWRVASLDHQDVSDEEIEYFRAHPDQIDEVSSPLTLHKFFLWAGLALGVVLVACAKMLAHSGILEPIPPGIGEFISDIVFEIGVALIGAAIVTFMIGIALNQQQARAKLWRKEIRRRLAEKK